MENKIKEHIVLIGGGGGVYRLARFLKNIRPNISTIQTVFDSGGHSGALRDEHGVLPPGDIRRAILALADDNVEKNLRELLSYRFPTQNKTTSLDGVTMGNLLLTALTSITGSLPQAINEMCKWYGVKGKVLPISLDDAHIKATLSDGSHVLGEKYIDTRSIDDDRTITDIELEPNAHIFVDAYEAIASADKIVFCPGDLYTSLIPNFLVDGFQEALRESNAKIIYVTNIMTKKAETDGFSASQFVKTIKKYIGEKEIDVVIANNGSITYEMEESYGEQKAHIVHLDSEELSKEVGEVIEDDLVDIAGGIVRHDEKIASLIADL